MLKNVLLTKLDYTIINYAKEAYHSVHNFLFMSTFGVPINLFFLGGILLTFVLYELEHNQKVQVFLQSLAEHGLLKYVTLGFIILVVIIMSV
jgi:hypothetical protein